MQATNPAEVRVAFRLGQQLLPEQNKTKKRKHFNLSETETQSRLSMCRCPALHLANMNQSQVTQTIGNFIYSAQVIGKHFLFTKIGTHVQLQYIL